MSEWVSELLSAAVLLCCGSETPEDGIITGWVIELTSRTEDWGVELLEIELLGEWVNELLSAAVLRLLGAAVLNSKFKTENWRSFEEIH